MSYDVCVTVDAGGPERVQVGASYNITYNLAPMFHEAGCDMRTLGECRIAVPLLLSGIHDMLANPEKYRALNPANGWGDYEGAVEFLRQVLSLCQAAPAGRVEVY